MSAAGEALQVTRIVIAARPHRADHLRGAR